MLKPEHIAICLAQCIAPHAMRTKSPLFQWDSKQQAFRFSRLDGLAKSSLVTSTLWLGRARSNIWAWSSYKLPRTRQAKTSQVADTCILVDACWVLVCPEEAFRATLVQVLSLHSASCISVFTTGFSWRSSTIFLVSRSVIERVDILHLEELVILARPFAFMAS